MDGDNNKSKNNDVIKYFYVWCNVAQCESIISV